MLAVTIKKTTSRLVINPINQDGTYEFKNIPDFKGIFDHEFKGLVNASGEWSIETIGTVGDGQGNMKKHWGLVLTGATEELSRIGFMDNAPYKLIIGFGDPDEGKAMIFKRNLVH